MPLSSSSLPLASPPSSSPSPGMAVPLHHHHHHHHHRLTSLPSTSYTLHPRLPPPSPDSSASISPHSPLLCLLCFKEFPSSRSLAGHMRIHGGLLHGSHHHPPPPPPHYDSPPPLPTMNATAIVGGAKALLRIYGGGPGESVKFCHDMAALEREDKHKDAGLREDESVELRGSEDRRRRKKRRRSSSCFESAGTSATTEGEEDDAELAAGYGYGGSGAEYLTTDQIPAKPRYKVVDSLIRSASHMKPLNLQPYLTCHICGKSFFSQHALSGHMRCHGGGGAAAAAHRPRPSPTVTPSYPDQSRPRIKVSSKRPPLPTEASAHEYAEDSYGSRRANSLLDKSMRVSARPEHRPEPSPPPALIKGKSLSSRRRKRCPSLFFQLHRRIHVAESHEIVEYPEASVDVDLNVTDTGPTGVAVAAADDSAACSLLMLRAAKTDVGPARLGVETARPTRQHQTKDRIPEEEEEVNQMEKYEAGDEEADDEEEEEMMIEAAADSGGGGRVYECKTCRRWFRSPQALGGHRASHNKVIGGGVAGLQFTSAVAADRHPWQGSYGSLIHPECLICRRNGNEKRRDWWMSRKSAAGDAAALCHIAEASSVKVPPSSSIAEQQTLLYAARGGEGGRSAIDLNVEPPVAESGEEEVDYDVLSWEAAVGDARKRLCMMSGGAGGHTRLLGGEEAEGGEGSSMYSNSDSKAAWDARRRQRA